MSRKTLAVLGLATTLGTMSVCGCNPGGPSISYSQPVGSDSKSSKSGTFTVSAQPLAGLSAGANMLSAGSAGDAATGSTAAEAAAGAEGMDAGASAAGIGAEGAAAADEATGAAIGGGADAAADGAAIAGALLGG